MREQDKSQSEVIQRKFLCQLIYKKWCPQSRITRCSTGLPALLAVVILLSFGNSAGGVWADMRPTGTASDPREIVVALIDIRFQMFVVAFQKLLCMTELLVGE